MYIVNTEQMRALDLHTIEHIGIPAFALMENAGKAIAEEVLSLCREAGQHRSGAATAVAAPGGGEAPFASHGIAADASLHLPNPSAQHWLVLAGKGSNGGDGAAAARHLCEAGLRVTLLYAAAGPAELSGAAALQQDAAAKLGIPQKFHGRDEAVELRAYTGIVDALLGTGASGAPRGAYAALIQAANDSGLPIVSADIPSGLDADTGARHEPCVRASVTVCLAFLKRGLVQYPGAEAAGRVVVRSIGIPSSLCRQHGVNTFLLTPDVLRGELQCDPKRPRSPEGHKGTYGHVLTAAGSRTMSGAGLLCSRAALRAGSGLVTWALPEELLLPMSGAAPELMLTPVEASGRSRGVWSEASADKLIQLLESRDVLAAGPGIGRFDGDSAWVRRLWESSSVPLVLDADALNALADAPDTGKWVPRQHDTVLTPHPGEMARLAGISTAEVQRDRIGTAVGYALRNRVTLVLKGSRTVIACPDGRAFVNVTGHPGMATGGTGDVLTGIIAGLLAQGLSGPQAAALGVRLHGLAGERAAQARGHFSSVTAGDVIEAL
ncbi:NAD(P)H-hydrate dehydratase [Paenibacillus lemnae]|uniref:Bifunctional NAD(P)H-hydrate repair enzyme n=1 Tax=Paenibacillus lemnae TaxID=1330551 RepID=A0A848MD22_PAELE|nr:NAD(P)H-hydrate dehydratase [Paenibacillus lemnae]NMO98139.1 NAD(P)H-hydrate dehydratase [Paenibacillus lemnae]